MPVTIAPALEREFDNGFEWKQVALDWELVSFEGKIMLLNITFH